METREFFGVHLLLDFLHVAVVVIDEYLSKNQ
jgi:hypothetical protein